MNRRALLVAGCGLAVAGCRGRDDDAGSGAPVSETSRRGDVELLEQLAANKAVALAGYRANRSVLRGPSARFAAIEREHLDRLAAELGERGAALPAGGHGMAPAEDPLDALIDLEALSIALLIDVVPKLGDPPLRALGAELLAVEAQQLSVLRVQAGSPALPDAFVYGGRPG